MTRALVAVTVAVVVFWGAADARADMPVVLYRLDPLGLDTERALRLEALFREELSRMTRVSLPGRLAIEAALAKERPCAGEPACLAAIGRKLGAAKVVFGNVAQLGDSYVVNLKLIDAVKGTEIRRVSEPLKGSADDLIEAVRVAAYRLVLPEELKGSLEILCDVPGAAVTLDGARVGTTPLQRPLDGLTVGSHTLRIDSEGYTRFQSPVEVRFQKRSQVVVRLLLLGGPYTRKDADTPWYASPWMYAAVGAGALILGFVIGRALASDSTIDCQQDPAACLPQ